METIKFDAADAFILIDFEGAPATGIARQARKVLRSSASSLARTVTYSFAAFGIERCGASAGINAEGDAIADAVKSFSDEALPLVADGRLSLDPGLGLSVTDFAELLAADLRPDETIAQTTELTVAGAIAAKRASTYRVIGSGPLVDELHRQLDGSEHVTDDETVTDAIYVAGKVGVFDHTAVDGLRANSVVPLTPLPVTAKAHAALGRAGIEHVPDFVTVAAPLLAGHDADGGDPIDRIEALMVELRSDDRGPWWAAIDRAEAFISTWQPELPFGRPLA